MNVNFELFYSRNYKHQPREGGGINWLYVGAFHPGIREPGRLLQLVRALNRRGNVKVYLDMYGPTNGFDLNPKDSPEIRHWGYLDRERAIERMKSTDFIVNVDNENCVMTPSKIVECIATGRPIINFANPKALYAPIKAYEELGYVFSQTKKQIDEAMLECAEVFIKRHLKCVSASERDVRSIRCEHLSQVQFHLLYDA